MVLTRRTATILSLCVSVGVASLLVDKRPLITYYGADRVTHSTIITENGSKLRSVFDGSLPDPGNDLAQLPSGPRLIARCTSLSKALAGSALARAFRQSVQAQSGCSTSLCGGTRYVQNTLSCPEPACVGSFRRADVSAGGAVDQGSRIDGTFGCRPGSGYECTQTYAITLFVPLP